jgi:hypothetical protein
LVSYQGVVQPRKLRLTTVWVSPRWPRDTPVHKSWH